MDDSQDTSIREQFSTESNTNSDNLLSEDQVVPLNDFENALQQRQTVALGFLGNIDFGSPKSKAKPLSEVPEPIVAMRPFDLLQKGQELEEYRPSPVSEDSGASSTLIARPLNNREKAAADFLGTISLGRPGRIPGGKQAGANFVGPSPRPSFDAGKSEITPELSLPSIPRHLARLRLKTSSLPPTTPIPEVTTTSSEIPLLPSSSAAKRFGSFRNLVSNASKPSPSPLASEPLNARRKSMTAPTLPLTPTLKRERRVSQQLTLPDLAIKSGIRSMESPGVWQVVSTPNGIVRTWTSDTNIVHPILDQVKQQQVELQREMEKQGDRRNRRTESFGGISNVSSMDEEPFSPQDVQPPLLLVPGNQLIQAKVGHAIVSELNGGQSVMLVTPKGSPLSVWSVHRYMGPEERAGAKRVQASEKPDVVTKPLFIGDVAALIGPGGAKRKAESFATALEPSGMLENDEPDVELYDPDFIDDPTLKTGKHRTVMTLPSWVGSVIHYVRPAELIQELNEQFRSTHPDVDPSLTLIMIRALKKTMLSAATECGLEWSSVAVAYVYLDKLIMAGRVQKLNRKLCGAICLLLAAKVNDPKETDFLALLQGLSKHFQIPMDIIKKFEFQAYAALEFALYVAPWEVAPHLDRVLQQKGLKLDDYIRQGGPQANPDYNLDFYSGHG